jgi:hypothetical protein
VYLCWRKRKLLVVLPMPEKSKGKGQLKCSPWTYRLGVGRGATPEEFTVTKPRRRPRPTEGCSTSKLQEGYEVTWRQCPSCPGSGSKIKSRKQEVWTVLACLVYFSTLKMETVPRKFLPGYTAHIPEDSTAHSCRCENLISKAAFHCVCKSQHEDSVLARTVTIKQWFSKCGARLPGHKGTGYIRGKLCSKSIIIIKMSEISSFHTSVKTSSILCRVVR